MPVGMSSSTGDLMIEVEVSLLMLEVAVHSHGCMKLCST